MVSQERIGFPQYLVVAAVYGGDVRLKMFRLKTGAKDIMNKMRWKIN